MKCQKVPCFGIPANSPTVIIATIFGKILNSDKISITINQSNSNICLCEESSVKTMLIRLTIAIWFVGMVGVAVRGMPVQGQTPTEQKNYLPLITRRAFAFPPANWGDYVAMFVSKASGTSTIYTMRGDGSDLTPLTVDAQPKREPRRSPDGRYIAYVHTAIDWYEALVVMNADGSVPQQVAASDETIFYRWSPTANQVLVQVRQGYPFNLLLVDAESATVRPIVTLPQEYAYSSLWGWSPDGRYIHFTQPGATYNVLELWTEDVATGIRMRVTAGMSGTMFAPQWSPDSRELLYVEGETWRAATPDGSVTRPLFDGAYRLAGWVMEDSHYLLHGYLPNTVPLAIVPVTGEDIIPIGPEDGSVSDIHIAPNGEEILYLSEMHKPFPTGQVYWHSLVPDATPVSLAGCGENCDIDSATWAEDGQTVLFTLEGVSVYLAHLRPTPYRATRLPFYSDDQWSVAYLPGSSRLAMISKTSSGAPYYYPPPFIDKPRLIDDGAGTVSPFPFTSEGMFEFGEWWYQP
jgi:dipeptidyl aminopeptidase/acylaminoacyl peptidase